MTPEEITKRLIAAGFTVDELRRVAEALNFSVVLAEAGEHETVHTNVQLTPEKLLAMSEVMNAVIGGDGPREV